MVYRSGKVCQLMLGQALCAALPIAGLGLLVIWYLMLARWQVNGVQLVAGQWHAESQGVVVNDIHLQC